MKVPDKIYMPEVAAFFQGQQEKEDGLVEYISKDALLEWLNEKKEKKEQKPADKPKWDDSDMREDESELQTRFAFYTYKDDSSELYLSNLFVEEGSRNHGFGTRILNAAEKVAETIGASSICLKVKQNTPANAWYRKRGYGYVAFEDGYDWLQKNLEYMKPAEYGSFPDWKTSSDYPKEGCNVSLNGEVKKIQDWSEEDEKPFNDVLSGLKYAYEDLINHKSLDSAKDIKEAFDWMQARMKNFRPQPKQEWSGEDENALKYLHELIGFGFSEKFMDAQTAADMRDWVNKSLRPQYHGNVTMTEAYKMGKEAGEASSWKPSEEDEINIGWLISYLKGENAGEFNELMKESLISWLKSLPKRMKEENTSRLPVTPDKWETPLG